MKKLLPLLLGLLTLAPALAQTAQETEDEAWRLREMSEGKARRSARGLELATARGWKRPDTEGGAWLWIGLRVDGQFHALHRPASLGAEAWAWMSRRSGRLTQFPAEPVARRDGGFLVLPYRRAATPAELLAWVSRDGELQRIEFREVIGLQPYTDLFFNQNLWLNAKRDGIEVTLRLSDEGRAWSVIELPPPPSLH